MNSYTNAGFIRIFLILAFVISGFLVSVFINNIMVNMTFSAQALDRALKVKQSNSGVAGGAHSGNYERRK